MARQQTEKDIKNLSGLAGIRAKISMYLGGSGGSAMWTAKREKLDNGVDEASAGRNNLVHYLLDPEHPLGSWTVDAGGGMPVGQIDVENPLNQKMEKISALKALVGLTHTGGKFDLDDENDGMRGTHGVGIKATNAASELFHVWTFRDKQWWETAYERGRETIAVRKAKGAPKLPDGSIPKKGTVIYSRLDASVFDAAAEMDVEEMHAWFAMTAAFATKLTLRLTDAEGEVTEWACTGPEAYLDSVIEDSKANLIDDKAKIACGGKFWDMALAFTDFDGIELNGFTNGLSNPDGGTHVNAVYDAVSAAVSPYAKRGHKFNPTDLREGLVGVINVKLTGVKFHNQEKSKLVDERAAGPLRDQIFAELQDFFAANRKIAELICERATSLAQLKQEFRQNKKVMKVLKDAKRKKTLPVKLAAAMNCTNEQRELFLVEGDSAGGSAKQARDSSYQEVLPLKGKIINPYGPKAAQAMENEETLQIMMALGYDPSLDNPFENLRVGIAILLMDADVDGLHIQNLVTATLVKFVPQMINEGRVYLAKRYEYMTQQAGKKRGEQTQYWFAQTREELEKLAPKATHGSIMHLKGLGEVEPEVLARMAFDPANRQLIQLKPLDSKQIKRIAELAGTDSAHRKELLGTN